MEDKDKARTKTLEGPKANDEDDNVLLEFGTKKVPEVFSAAIATEVHSRCDKPVVQDFRVWFSDNPCTISVLKAGRYMISQLASTMMKGNSIYVEEKSNVLELLMPYHCVKHFP